MDNGLFIHLKDVHIFHVQYKMLHFDWNQDDKSFHFRILLPVLGSYKILSRTELYEDQARKQRQRQACPPCFVLHQTLQSFKFK